MADVDTCFYCGQKITLVDNGPRYGVFWCVDPPGGLGTAVCRARDDFEHSPVEENDDDE